MSKELPSNLKVIWNRGSRSYVDSHYHKIVGGYASGQINTLFRKFAVEGEQLSEEEFKSAFDIAVTFAQANLGLARVLYIRSDLDNKTPENSNNRAYQGNSQKIIKIYGYEQKKGMND